MTIGGNVDVYSALPNGNDVRRLTDDASFEACPGYSPDGQNIAYCSAQSGPFEIWAMKQNGKKRHQVTHLNARSLFPDYSPDGSKIAFSASGVGGDMNTEIFVVNTDDTGLQQLTANAGDNAYPAWSPDGTKIAFTSTRTRIEQVWVMNADGSGQTPSPSTRSCTTSFPTGARTAPRSPTRTWLPGTATSTS